VYWEEMVHSPVLNLGRIYVILFFIYLSTSSHIDKCKVCTPWQYILDDDDGDYDDNDILEVETVARLLV
jgi:hypothetical protein